MSTHDKDTIEVYAIGKVNYYEGHEIDIRGVAEEIGMNTEDLISGITNMEENVENKLVKYLEGLAVGEDPECDAYEMILNADRKDGSIHYTLVSDFTIDRCVKITEEMTAEEFINSLNDYNGETAAIGYVDIRADNDYSELKESKFYNSAENKFELGDEGEISEYFEDFKKELFSFKENELFKDDISEGR